MDQSTIIDQIRRFSDDAHGMLMSAGAADGRVLAMAAAPPNDVTITNDIAQTGEITQRAPTAALEMKSPTAQQFV